MNLNHKTNFENGDQLNAQDWNRLAADVNELGTNSTNGAGSGNSVADTHIPLSSKGNVEFTTTEADLNAKGKGGKINIESYRDILLKPGDDVVFTSSHRPVKNMDEITMKIHDGEDHPVKLQLNTAEIVLTAKDKNLTMTKDENGKDTTTAMYDDPNVMNVTVNSDKNTRGYLKVRAQAIDLRCEDHGGIALQPKGNDGKGHENKIKFEHNGGDGLEFGTFNTEHTSIFTTDYRFNKDGIIYAVTRGTPVSTYKEDGTIKKTDYPTQEDDFKDIIDSSTYCTWGDLVSYIKWVNSTFDITHLISNENDTSISSSRIKDVFGKPSNIIYAPNGTINLIVNGDFTIGSIYKVYDNNNIGITIKGNVPNIITKEDSMLGDIGINYFEISFVVGAQDIENDSFSGNGRSYIARITS